MSQPDTFIAGNSSSEIPPAAGTVPVPGRWVLVLILLLVNSGATIGQSGWFRDNVTTKVILGAGVATVVIALVLAVILGGVLEMIGAYLAMMADALDARGMPSGGIRAGSYATGLLIGTLNFAHWWAYGWQASVALGFLSAISPFLWGILARVRRGTLTAPSRRIWHPIRSFELIRYAAWEGIADEDQARMSLELSRNPADDARPVSGAGERTKEDIGAEAIRIKSDHPERSWERIGADMGYTPSYLYQCRKIAGGIR